MFCVHSVQLSKPMDVLIHWLCRIRVLYWCPCVLIWFLFCFVERNTKRANVHARTRQNISALGSQGAKTRESGAEVMTCDASARLLAVTAARETVTASHVEAFNFVKRRRSVEEINFNLVRRAIYVWWTLDLWSSLVYDVKLTCFWKFINHGGLFGLATFLLPRMSSITIFYH